MKNTYLHVVITAIFAIVTGFNLDNTLVPQEQIMSGGPPKDGIPAIMAPSFISIAETRFMNPGDEVIAVHIKGEVKAYPLKILNWHEVVNDFLNGAPIVVTF